MTTYWVLGKGVSANQMISPMQAGVPQAQSPSLNRQTSHHCSLAAVVYGMMQAQRSSNINVTRKFPCFDALQSDTHMQSILSSV